MCVRPRRRPDLTAGLSVCLSARRLSVELLPNMTELAEINTSMQAVPFGKQIAVLLTRGYIKIKRDQVGGQPRAVSWRPAPAPRPAPVTPASAGRGVGSAIGPYPYHQRIQLLLFLWNCGRCVHGRPQQRRFFEGASKCTLKVTHFRRI